MQVIIGSTAIKHWYPDFNREPNDLDIVVHQKQKNTKGIEYHLNPVLLQVEKEKYITPNNMLTLKVSHLFWDNNWEKHIWDVQFLLQKGAVFNYSLYRRFREYWEQVLPKVRRSNLEMTKEDFFTNSVNEDIDEHDNLHYLLSSEPMFTKILKDGCEVELDFDKWDKLSFEDKIKVVVEEAVVMAYERYNKKTPWYTAYTKQLKDNIIKHYPEPIALFAIFNHKRLLNLTELKIQENFKKLNYEY